MSYYDYWSELLNVYFNNRDSYRNIRDEIIDNNDNNKHEVFVDYLAENYQYSYLEIYISNNKPTIELSVAMNVPRIDIYFDNSQLNRYNIKPRDIRKNFLEALNNIPTTNDKFKNLEHGGGYQSCRLVYKMPNFQINEYNFNEGINWQLSELNNILPDLMSVFNNNNLYVIDVNNETGNIDNNGELTRMIENKIENALINHKQIVLTGAPGTGKTFSVRKYVENQIDRNDKRFKFVQFHSSYDYTDFVEGLRPVPSSNSTQNMFVRLDGTFKRFCRIAFEDYLKHIFKEFDSKITDEKYELVEELYNYKKKLLKYNREELSKILRENLSEGVSLDDYDKYYFVIDEINRADLSKVFGELMFGLDEAYRGIENRFETQYSNLDTYHKVENGFQAMEFDCFKNGFFIPENVIIIGTMNDIDRSVESFDFALRRRFQWIEIKANEAIDDKLNSMLPEGGQNKLEQLKQLAKNINNIISNNTKYKMGLNDAYHLGPSYFKDYNGSNIKDIYESKILPILKEYTRGRNNELFIRDVENLINNFDINNNNNNN